METVTLRAKFVNVTNRIYSCQGLLLPTDAQENCFKRIIQIYTKTAATRFGVITIIRESAV